MATSRADASLSQVSSTNFVHNMRLPVHRWFRYSAGFSARWVESLLESSEGARVLDPFAGSATTLVASQSAGSESIGLDPHPLLSRVSKAKLDWVIDPSLFEDRAQVVLASFRDADLPEGLPPLLRKCYPDSTLASLLGLRDAILAGDQGPAAQLVWLAFVAIIRPTSPVGTAQWQYVLPNRAKASSLSVLDAWRVQTSMMASDMRLMQATVSEPPSATMLRADARELGSAVPAKWATHVICSPPYLNNYDYADATRLEQTVLGEVEGWSDLASIREDLIRACTQHMAGYDAEAALHDPLLAPLMPELNSVYEQLAEIRLTKGGRKAYHSMVVAYFHDMARVWQGLADVCSDGAEVCWVLGDSAPYGVHVPVDQWMARLAEAAGFSFDRFDKVRDRNTRWKNRKHRVPLHEGNLWLVR